MKRVFMGDNDVDMDEEEEEEVVRRKATTGLWWEECGEDGNCDTLRGSMVNSRSWAEELQDIFAPQTEDCYSGGRTRLPSISLQYMRGSPESSFTAA
ncbi:hypothetical protein NQZ68_001663 [Dissostichus eleginoides]|nr:hypothetical protein NQZ68_001663 [Dissostichus eleginoides]